MKYFLAGDSHGPTMIGILAGFPAGWKIDVKAINDDLFLRKSSFGRGLRTKIEKDEVDFVSGVCNSLTTGAPITFFLKNKASNTEKSARSIPRPGHGDYSAYAKYKVKDFNVYAERNSARWTVLLTVIGSLSRQLLNYLGIDVVGYVKRLGMIEVSGEYIHTKELRKMRNNSEVFCPDREASLKMINEVRFHEKEGTTLGGKVKIVSTSIPAGLGDYSEIESKIDARLSSLLISIPSVKGLIFGNEIYDGKTYSDAFRLNNEKIERTSNNCGGIEGGFTNGSPLNIELFIKPIPTMKRFSKSVDFLSKEEVNSPYIRSDSTSVPSIAIISEAAVSFILLDALIDRYGNGNIEDIKMRIENDSFEW